jgi:hypothetical protein
MSRAALAFTTFTICGLVARADVGVVLADPTGVGASQFTHAGHSLVYLSGVCADSPIRARLCKPGEQGSVVTTYPNFRETQAYAWNLVPLSLYLQGSLTPGDRLLYASLPVKQALEVHAREGYLQSVCADGHCPELPHSFWRDIVGVTAVRDVFIFAVQTTPAQDQAAVDWLNSEPNVNHYNGITNNCAVFTRSLINLIFPHSVHRDFPNDLGMMAPKAAARSFTRWALKRPELGFYSAHFAQQPGDLPRSGLAQSGTETGIHMKKYLIAAALIGDHEVAGSFFVAYFLTGRFGLYKEFSHHPSPSTIELETEAKAAKQGSEEAQALALQYQADQSRTDVMGTPQEWADYRERFAMLQTSVEAQELSLGHKRFFQKQLDTAVATVDADGNPWLVIESDGSTRQIGVSSRNLLADQSDPAFTFQLMLGRVGFALHAKNHMRETMEEFRQDWALLEQTRIRLIASRGEQIRVATALP